ncbi:MAG: glucokinase [Rhizobiales bacterium]|nr:glucokinase [Hyphomicrobiales bacterium]MBI3672743.1 glucokinase [Hyphomicrobiales bacterium]
MAELALVGDIGGTNSRFGLVELGSTAVRQIEVRKNNDFNSLEDAVAHYVEALGLTQLAAAAIDVAGPVEGEIVSLTNRDWSFTRESLRQAARARRFRLLNDFEALALSLPHLGPSDVVQIGGETPPRPEVKIVMGPGTGLGMATLAPLPQGGWMALPGEVGHITLPVVTREEFDLREKMTRPGVLFESEDAITGGGLLRMYQAIAEKPGQATPEDVVHAALAGTDAAAVRTLDQFIVWLARIAGDVAMTMQARGGVYLAGGIAPSIVERLKSGPFRTIFQEKGRLAHVMRPIPVYVIVDPYPAFKGCAAALME